MHPALRSVDVVGKGDHDLAVPVVVLHSHLSHAVLPGAGHIDHVAVQGVLALVEEGDELPDAPLIAHIILLLLSGAQVHSLDPQSGIEESLLPHPGMEGLIAVHKGVEHLWIRLEGDCGASVVSAAHHLHLLGDLAPGEFHLIDLAVLMDLDLQPLAQGVHY